MPRSIVRTMLCLAIVTAGCATATPPPSRAAPSGVDHSTSAPAHVYSCADGFRFSVRLRGDSAILSLPTRVVSLPQVVAASGVRYAAAGLVFWSKGDEASLEEPSGSHGGCHGRAAATPWEEARLLGYEFRGLGQEPGWTLEIDQGRSIRFIADYGQRRVHTPVPEPKRGAGGRVTYHAKTEAADLTVTIEPRDCRDVMSGEAMTHAVTVVLNGAEYRGCGRMLRTGEVLLHP